MAFALSWTLLLITSAIRRPVQLLHVVLSNAIGSTDPARPRLRLEKNQHKVRFGDDLVEHPCETESDIVQS